MLLVLLLVLLFVYNLLLVLQLLLVLLYLLHLLVLVALACAANAQQARKPYIIQLVDQPVLAYDGKVGRVTDNPEADKLLRRTYRPGWTLNG